MRAEAVAVVGAAGGVGASTVAALLAARLARGRPVTLVDLDLRRGGIEVLLGTESGRGARWPDLAGVRGPVVPEDLDGLLPRWGPLEVLGPDRRAVDPDGAAVAAVWAGLLASGRTVVADVPAAALVGGPTAGGSADGGARDAVVGLVRDARALVVTGQDVLGVAAAAAVLPSLGPGAVLALRRRRGARVAPAQAGAVLRVRVAGLVPTDRRVAGAVDRGLGPVVAGWSPLARAVGRLAQEVSRA